MRLQRWTFLKELLPLLLIFGALDYFAFGSGMFTQELSPLWLLILLIAPRRGSVAGFVCGLVAAAIYLWALSEQGYLLQDLLHRRAEFLIMPGLFLFFGTYLGMTGESQIRRMEYFRERARTLGAQLDSTEIKLAELERSRLEMEKRIAGQGATLLTLHSGFKRLGGASSEEDLLFALESLIREESGAKDCGIWRISGNKSRLAAGHFDGPLPEMAMSVGKNCKVQSVADWSSHMDAGPASDLAALVLETETERLVVTLGRCPFTRLTRDFVLRIGMLAEQGGMVLGSLRDREKLRSQAALDADSGLASETYLRRRVNEEIALARRHKTQLSLLACAISTNSEILQPRLRTALSCSIRSCIRFSDGLAWFPNAKAFVIVLPQCDETGARIVLKKIVSRLEMLNLQDEKGQKIYELEWGTQLCADEVKGDAVFTSLFSGMRKVESQ